ncbi:MAG TPA: neutral/alkaline non-lysosomal ceramidase C-terminal domain-containing protein, partial [Thermoleophilaceae bacterium]|nr:neutral/alkaline non-lysosomal ceramidase C-terminal domain-containing protein [Thermoleophilaceae bacterium]
KREIAGLAGRLARNQPAPAPYAFDPTNGIGPTAADYGPGAASATALSQPRPAYARLQRAELSWQGGRLGHDRPVDKAFVSAQRLTRKGWVTQDSDLGLAMLWTVDGQGRYRVKWEIPRHTPRGTYRLLVTGKRYTLASNRFRVFGSSALKVMRVAAAPGKYTVALALPGAVRDVDLTYRPRFADGGQVRFRVGSRTVTVKRKSSPYFTVRASAGTPVTVAPLAARDRHKNANGAAFSSR